MASFLAIARLGSFRLAARELGISQGAISQQLQKLEGLLGARLIERHPRGCRLTVEGRAFEAHGRELERRAAAAVNLFRKRQLVIGASSNIGIYLLHSCLDAYGKVVEGSPAFDIQIHQNPVVAEKLAGGDVDVAIMEWWDDRPGYVARVWRSEELVVIVAPHHPWAGKRCVNDLDLRDMPLLGGEPGTGTGRLLADYLGVGLADLPLGKRLGSTDAVKQWVKAGMGVSVVLAGTVEEEVGSGSLVAIPLAGTPPRKPLYVAWRDSLSSEHMACRFGNWLATRTEHRLAG